MVHGNDGAVQVVKVRPGVVQHVRLVDEHGHAGNAAGRFLQHLADRGMSPNTMCAYGYHLKPRRVRNSTGATSAPPMRWPFSATCGNSPASEGPSVLA